MPTPKLKVGSGLHRARRNRSRGPRPKITTAEFFGLVPRSALSASAALKKHRRARS